MVSYVPVISQLCPSYVPVMSGELAELRMQVQVPIAHNADGLVRD